MLGTLDLVVTSRSWTLLRRSDRRMIRASLQQIEVSSLERIRASILEQRLASEAAVPLYQVCVALPPHVEVGATNSRTEPVCNGNLTLEDSSRRRNRRLTNSADMPLQVMVRRRERLQARWRSLPMLRPRVDGCCCAAAVETQQRMGRAALIQSSCCTPPSDAGPLKVLAVPAAVLLSVLAGR